MSTHYWLFKFSFPRVPVTVGLQIFPESIAPRTIVHFSSTLLVLSLSLPAPSSHCNSWKHIYILSRNPRIRDFYFSIQKSLKNMQIAAEVSEMEDLWKSRARSLQFRLRDRFRVAIDRHCRRPMFSTDGYFSSTLQRWLRRFRDFRRDSLSSSSAFYRKRGLSLVLIFFSFYCVFPLLFILSWNKRILISCCSRDN